MPDRDLIEEQLHTVAIDVRQDEGIQFTISDGHGCVSIGMTIAVTMRRTGLGHQQRRVSVMRPKRASS